MARQVVWGRPCSAWRVPAKRTAPHESQQQGGEEQRRQHYVKGINIHAQAEESHFGCLHIGLSPDALLPAAPHGFSAQFSTFEGVPQQGRGLHRGPLQLRKQVTKRTLHRRKVPGTSCLPETLLGTQPLCWGYTTSSRGNAKALHCPSLSTHF